MIEQIVTLLVIAFVFVLLAFAVIETINGVFVAAYRRRRRRR